MAKTSRRGEKDEKTECWTKTRELDKKWRIAKQLTGAGVFKKIMFVSSTWFQSFIHTSNTVDVSGGSQWKWKRLKRVWQYVDSTQRQWRNELTLWELWWVVVNICEGDFDLGGPWQPPHVAAHIFGLDDDVVFLPRLTVHVWQGSADYTWKWNNAMIKSEGFTGQHSWQK